MVKSKCLGLYIVCALFLIATSVNGNGARYNGVEYNKPYRPLNILCTFRKFPLLSETFALNQITGLIDRGHRVIIHAEREGRPIMHPNVIKYRLLDCAYIGQLPPDMFSYDIILCQFGQLGKKFLEIKKQLGLKAKIVTCFRGSDISKEIQLNGPRVYDELFKEGDLFLPVCDYFKTILTNLGCDPRKILVHHSAIDTRLFAFNNTYVPGQKNTVSIVSVNRLTEKKGMFYGITAVARLLKKYPFIRYTIMGDGPLKEPLTQLIKKNKAEHAITLRGWGTSADVVALLKEADIFILPSLTDKEGNQEGIPNALKEAMAVGVPVVSTDHAGIKELVHNGKTGLLVPSGNSKQLAEKIEYFITHPRESYWMRYAAREHIEREYDTNVLNDQLVAIFYQLLNNGGVAGSYSSLYRHQA